MWDILHQQAFLVGAMLVAIYQAAKFTELNLADPITKRYVALLPDANVRDFASSYAYHTALFAFLGVSLVVYFLLCQISPDLVKGAARLLSPGETSASLENIPYPLYIAASKAAFDKYGAKFLTRGGEWYKKSGTNGGTGMWSQLSGGVSRVATARRGHPRVHLA
jgi:hypothetical protein